MTMKVFEYHVEMLSLATSILHEDTTRMEYDTINDELRNLMFDEEYMAVVSKPYLKELIEYEDNSKWAHLTVRSYQAHKGGKPCAFILYYHLQGGHYGCMCLPRGKDFKGMLVDATIDLTGVFGHIGIGYVLKALIDEGRKRKNLK